MTIHFTSRQIAGKGRGKFMGYPTINLEVPKDFELDHGIYAVWVTLNSIQFKGAMHWGPIPTFDEQTESLEVFLLGLEGQDLSHTETTHVEITVVQKLRPIEKFDSVVELTTQIGQDVDQIRAILKE